MAQSVLTQDLKVQLVTVSGELELEVEFETTHDPKPEILMQARIKIEQTRLFQWI